MRVLDDEAARGADELGAGDEERAVRDRAVLDPSGYDEELALLAGEEDGFAFLTLRPAIWYDGPVAQLEELYVVPALRDRGIGTRILDLARQVVRDAGAPEMHINVDEVDTDTRRFYERHGFVNIEEGEDYRMLCYIGPTLPG